MIKLELNKLNKEEEIDIAITKLENILNGYEDDDEFVNEMKELVKIIKNNI